MADADLAPTTAHGQYLASRTCVQCGGIVVRTGRELRKYCSDECAKERKRLIRAGKAKRQCDWCTGDMTGRPSAQKFCCDECRKESERVYIREYYGGNVTTIRENAKVYNAKKRAADPEWRKPFDAAYLAANRDRLNAERRTPEHRKIARERFKRRYDESPHLRLHNRMGSAIYQALQENKAGRKWESLVGYTLEALYRHLERQFLRGMSWDNMGTWHIDHILPRAMFKYETPDCPDFKACWAISNLRPLWSQDNQAKSDKRTLLI